MRKLLILTLCTLLSAGLYAQKDFYGTIEYTYTLAGEGAEAMQMFMPTGMTTYYAKNKMATKMSGGMMAQIGRIIVNDGEAFVVSESDKTIYMMEDEDVEEAETENTQEATKIEGETREILGYTCQKYKMKTNMQGQETTQYIYATSKLKVPDIDTPAQAAGANGMLGASNIEGMPLMVVVELPGGEIEMTMEAVEMKKDDVPDGIFDKPADYTVKPFSEMMK